MTQMISESIPTESTIGTAPHDMVLGHDKWYQTNSSQPHNIIGANSFKCEIVAS